MSTTTKTRQVAILVFDDVEVLDFCGPFEVFSVTGQYQPQKPFGVHIVAERLATVTAQNGLKVVPDFALADSPPAELLIVPGGQGTRREMHNAALLHWIGERSAAAELTLSVCTGSLLLAKANLLDRLRATTHHRRARIAAFDRTAQRASKRISASSTTAASSRALGSRPASTCHCMS